MAILIFCCQKFKQLRNTITSTLKVTNFTFKGEKAKNYVADKSASLTTTVATTTVTEKLTKDENVTIEAAPVDDKTIIVTEVAAVPESEVKKVTIDVTAIADTKVNTVALPKATVDAIVGIDPEATLEITLKDGSDENKDSTIILNAQTLAAIQTAGGAAATVSISVEKTEAVELNAEQAAKVAEVATKTPVVYSLNITDEAGISLATSFGDAGKATATLPYAKPTGNGNVIVKYMDDSGNLTNISNPIYDASTQTVTVKLAHFSEYLIYTEPVRPSGSSGGSGGGGVSGYTVKFETNGGSAVKSVTVNKNAVATQPAAPTKDGFKFDGWYTDKELTSAYDFTAKVTKSFTLYAKWTEIEKDPEAEKPATSIAFTDVKENDWFYANVQYVAENNLMNGVAENKFAPNDTLTRAMLVTVLYRNAGEPAGNMSIPFADVDMSAWYANAVVWAKQNGIVNGVTENEFAPDNKITREQIAAIMFRYAQYKGMEAVMLEENLHFADANEISEYAVSAMNWAVGTGLINGKSATTLNPKDNATRAEIAAILQRFIEANK
ncbi:MAG: S-layer homology domain-containing protein [Clostridia bacterium]|nr:S-layer homology domain-containing protein [Clostridia bacterium]